MPHPEFSNVLLHYMKLSTQTSHLLEMVHHLSRTLGLEVIIEGGVRRNISKTSLIANFAILYKKKNYKCLPRNSTFTKSINSCTYTVSSFCISSSQELGCDQLTISVCCRKIRLPSSVDHFVLHLRSYRLLIKWLYWTNNRIDLKDI